MTLTSEQFEKFKELTRERVGDERFNQMSEQELMDSAMALITLVEAVYKPITKQEYDSHRQKE